MEYKLKAVPEVVYWQETKQFEAIDENGVEHTIRVTDSSKSMEHLIWNDDGGWEDLEDQEMLDWILEGMPQDEWDFEQEVKKEFEPKMHEFYDNYVKEKGEIKDIKQFADIISEMKTMDGIYDYKKNHYERFYTVYNFILNKIK